MEQLIIKTYKAIADNIPTTIALAVIAWIGSKMKKVLANQRKIEATFEKMKSFEEQAEEQEMMKQALLAILHDKVYMESSRILSNDKVKFTELDNLEYLFRSYQALGGNGVCKNLYERVQKLEMECDNNA